MRLDPLGDTTVTSDNLTPSLLKSRVIGNYARGKMVGPSGRFSNFPASRATLGLHASVPLASSPTVVAENPVFRELRLNGSIDGRSPLDIRQDSNAFSC